MRLERKADFAAGGDKNDFWFATWRIGKDISALGNARGWRIFLAVDGWQGLTRNYQDSRFVAELHDKTVGLDDFVGIAGPKGDEPGNCSQGSEVLDGLMGRAVFAVTHGIVREDEERWKLHKGGKPDRRTRVISEDEKCRPEAAELGKGHSVYNCAHGVLANSVMEISAARTGGLEMPRSLEGQGGLVRRPEIGRSTEEPGDILREYIQDLARGLAPGDPFWVSREDRKVAVPARRQFATLNQIDLVREFGKFGPISAEKLGPLTTGLLAARADTPSEMCIDTVGYEKLRLLGPSIAALGEANFIITKGLAMRFRSVLFVRRAVTDVAVQDNKRRPAFGFAEDLERVFDSIHVVCVTNAQNIPTISQETSGDIFGEGEVRVAFDRDMIVVEDPAKIIQTEVTRQRGGFGGNAFHHTAIAAHGVNIVIEKFETWLVVTGGKPFLGNCHADAGGDALPQRAGGGFNPGDPVIFRMAWCLAVELPEAADIVERHRRGTQPLVISIHGLGASEVQDRPEQH